MEVIRQLMDELREQKEEQKEINRVEIIDNENGRVYTNYNCKDVKISEQDGGTTLKIFLTNNK